jgi:hypothetical protein
VILVVVVLLCLISIVVVPGAVLLAIPIAVILAIVLVMLVRGAAASRGGTRIESDDVGAGVGDALAPPGQPHNGAADAAAERSRTQG